jgi:hypothetical protein
LKLKDISKLFKKYVDQLDFAIEVGESGAKEVDDDIATPQLKVLDLWVRTRDKAFNRRNKSQARIVCSLLNSNVELLVDKKCQLTNLAIKRGLIKNE